MISRLSPRAFPERVDFITSPGHRMEGRSRRELGMPGAGPVRVVTDKAILEADAESGELVLAALYPGVTPDEVRAGVGWPLRSRPALADVAPPTARELRPAPRRARPAATLPLRLTRDPMTAYAEPAEPPRPDAPELPRALGLRDLVLFNVVAVLSLRWFATAAAAGPSSIALWVLAALFFFVPQGLAVSDLAARYPDEGGIYAWTKRAFGEGHGFLCGWCYWVNNILYYPNLLMSTAVVGTYVIGTGRDRAGGQLDATSCRRRSWRSGSRCCSTSWAFAPGAGCRTWARWAPTSRASLLVGLGALCRASPGRRPRR